MSENRTNELRRRLRYTRRIQRKKAVSPVVATLILILIAVAAAAALYLWLVAWQGGVTKGIGSPGAQYTISIGGSTSAYPFAEEAATQFEANNSDVVVSVNQGGSGAGAAAVCSGQVDIGQASSFAYPVSTLISADGCPSTTVEQIVAYDGVDLITPTANAHGLQNMSWDTAQAIWTTASNEPAGYGGTTTSNIYANGNVHMDGVVAPVQLAQGSNYAWDQIPACDFAAAVKSGTTLYSADAQCGGASNPGEGLVTLTSAASTAAASITSGGSLTGATGTVIGSFTVDTISTPQVAQSFSIVTNSGSCPACTYTDTITGQSYNAAATTLTVDFSIAVAGATSGDTVAFAAAGDLSVDYAQVAAGSGTACGTNSEDICATTSSPYESPCGFTVCAGGTSSAAATHAIDLYYRSEVSGTTTGFLARLLAVSATGSLLAGANGGAANQLSFSGCGGDNEFDGCGLAFTGSNDHGETGNPNVISAVAGDPNGLGYASDGLAQASTSGVVPVNFEGYGQQVTVVIVGESTALKAISAGISAYFTSSTTFNTTQNYVGWRPFVNIETAPPTGEVERYLEFVMDPANNQNIAAETAEISIYASGLAGVVPITPIEGSTTLP